STSVQTVHRGTSVNISCNYKPSTDINGLTVELQTDNKLCSVTKLNNSWINQPCRNHCRFIWIPETVQMSFEISNLQINDTGMYKCVVTRTIPPPSVLLREERTFVQVALGGFHTILCSSEGFYPSALEQLNGEFQNASLTYSINKTNPDGTFTLHSYLNISDCVNYSCWVNHSSLSQPTILHMSPDCYGSRGITYFFYLKYIITLNTIVHYSHVHPGRAHHRSPVRVNVTPEPDLQSHLQYDIYSLLGDHHPVHCIPVGVHSSPQRTPNVLH
uniref:Ig-like domain-containing protein n=1 Tax=Cyprinus carpio carpio TaxID=630221 RepID=A0A8C1HS36_CYPCA